EAARATILLAREAIERFPRNGADDLYVLADARVMSSTWFSLQKPDEPSEAERAEQVREADLALDLLRQAVANGFRDYTQLTHWSGAKLIKERADFNALVVGLKTIPPQSAEAPTSDTGKVAERHRLPAAAGQERSAQAQENQAAARQAIGLVLLDLGKL